MGLSYLFMFLFFELFYFMNYFLINMICLCCCYWDNWILLKHTDFKLKAERGSLPRRIFNRWRRNADEARFQPLLLLLEWHAAFMQTYFASCIYLQSSDVFYNGDVWCLITFSSKTETALSLSPSVHPNVEVPALTGSNLTLQLSVLLCPLLTD